MAAPKNRRLVVDLVARTSKFTSGLDRSRKSLDKFQRSSRGLKGELEGIDFKEVAEGVTAFARGAVEALEKAASFGDTLAKLSDQTGFSVERIQGMRHAFELGGQSVERTDEALKKFTVKLGEMKAGTGEVVSGLEKLDPKLLDQLQRVKDGSEAWDVLIRRVGEYDTATEKAATLKLFVGERRATELARALEGGVEAIDAATAKLRGAGILIDEKAAARAEELADKLTEMRTTWQAGFSQAILQNSDRIMEVLKDIERIMPGIVRQLTAVVEKFAAVLGPLLADDFRGSLMRIAALTAGGYGVTKHPAGAIGGAAIGVVVESGSILDDVEEWFRDMYERDRIHTEAYVRDMFGGSGSAEAAFAEKTEKMDERLRQFARDLENRGGPLNSIVEPLADGIADAAAARVEAELAQAELAQAALAPPRIQRPAPLPLPEIPARVPLTLPEEWLRPEKPPEKSWAELMRHPAVAALASVEPPSPPPPEAREWLADLLREQEEFLAQQERIRESIRSFGDAFDDALHDAILGTESLTDALKELGRTIASDLLRNFVTGPISDFLSSWISGSLASPVSTLPAGGSWNLRPVAPNWSPSGSSLIGRSSAPPVTVGPINLSVQSTDGPGVTRALLTAEPHLTRAAHDGVLTAIQEPGPMRAAVADAARY